MLSYGPSKPQGNADQVMPASQHEPRAALTADQAGRRRTRLSPHMRERMILHAAIEFFAEEGFKGQTRELAKRLGVSQALIYRYFGSKEALIERVYESTFLSRWNPAWEELLTDRNRPLRQRLQEFLRSYLIAIEDRSWIRIAMHSSLADSDLTKRYIQSHVTRLLNLIVTELRAETNSKELGKPRPMELELAWHLHSTVIYFLIRKHIHNTSVSPLRDDVIETIVNNFFDGISSLGHEGGPNHADSVSRNNSSGRKSSHNNSKKLDRPGPKTNRRITSPITHTTSRGRKSQNKIK